MGGSDTALLRAAAFHMDRYRLAIAAEVDRRIGRGEPSPYVRAEIVRRFRSFSRLAGANIATACPSLDGLGGTSAAALEFAVSKAVEVARECADSEELEKALCELEERFRSGIRRITRAPPSEGKPRRGRRRKTPNAGRRVRAAIDRICDAYLALCLDTGKIYDVNPAAEVLLGVDATQLLERELAQLVGPSYRDEYRELEARLDAGEDSGPLDLAFARPGGDEVAVQVTVANHRIGSKRLGIFVAREPLSRQAYSTRIR
jgi:PAS domain S-box-containing protein